MARPIPGTGELLPVIGLGAPDVFIDVPPEGKELPKALLQAMIDQGGRYLDTPAFFRPNVPIVGDLLTEMNLQDELFLSGKITVNGKKAGIEHLERTVANLKKRPIDLLLIHNMRTLNEHWATLKDWKEEGRVRYIGVSLTRNLDYVDMERFMKAERPDFIMTGYSIHHPLAAESTLPLAADLGIAVLIVEAFKATDDGGIFPIVAGKPLPEWTAEFDCESWAQFSLKYILAHPAVTCVLTETTNPMHMEENIRAAFKRLPDALTKKRMRELVRTF